jgi:hypothetical protein
MALEQYELALQVTGVCEARASEVGHRSSLARPALHLDENGPPRPHRKIRAHSLTRCGNNNAEGVG